MKGTSIATIANSQIVRAEDDRIKQLLESATAANTRRAYEKDFQQFCQFCADRNVPCLPATPETIARYVATIESQFKAATIQRKVSAISKAHKQAGKVSPTTHPQVKELMKGLRNERSDQRQKQAPALTIDQVEAAARELYQISTARAKRDRALLLLGFFGAFRRSELAALTYDDIYATEKGLTAYIAKSKTDQEGEGKYKVFPYRPDHRSCPVRAYQDWSHAAATLPIDTSKAVFTSIGKGDKIKDTTLSGRDIDRMVKRLFGNEYSAHSLRAGFVTEARRKGARIESIKAQTGHKSDSTVLRYSRQIDAWEDNAAALL